MASARANLQSSVVSRPSLLFLLAVIPRVAALLYFTPPEPNYYWVLSDSLLKHHTFALESGPTTYMEPLYPAFLAAARLISGDVGWIVHLIQIGVAAAGAVLLFQLTRIVTNSVPAATLAWLFYAFDPYFVRQSVSYIELPVLVTLLLWAMKRLQSTPADADGRSGQILTGLLLGALLLIRASLFPIVAGALLLLAFRRARYALLAGLSTAIVVTPWIARNYLLDGSLLPSRVGVNLFVSTSEYAVGVLPEHDVDLLVPFAVEVVDRELGDLPPAELQLRADALLFSRAIEFARSHPRETAALKLRNLLYLFWPGILPVEPKSEDARAIFDGSRVHIVDAGSRPRAWEWLHFTARAVLLIAAILGMAVRRRHWREHALLCLVIVSVAAVHVVFFPTTRLLAPMTAVLMVYAGCGLDSLLKTLGVGGWKLGVGRF